MINGQLFVCSIAVGLAAVAALWAIFNDKWDIFWGAMLFIFVLSAGYTVMKYTWG